MIKTIKVLTPLNPPLSWGKFIFLLFLILSSLISCSKGDKDSGKKGKMPVPVITAISIEKDVPVELPAVGLVEAYSTVSIKSLAGGALDKIHFKEGQDVKKGQLLFTIDPRPYQAVLLQTQAAYARSLALMENAQRDAERYKKLADLDYIAKSQYEQYRTNADALAATLKADEANIENAKLALANCSIYSPLTGTTGSLLIDVGNLIKANDDTKPLVIINQIQPIYVTFALPAQYLSGIQKYYALGSLAVHALHLQSKEPPEKGVLKVIDNAVSNSTGTIQLKAGFDNSKKTLWPGEFVNVKLVLSIKKNVVVVPTAAVVSGQNSQIVYVIKDDQTVEIRNVTTGITNESETEIVSGLKTGERVVIDGQMQLMTGTKVIMKNPKTDQKQTDEKK